MLNSCDPASRRAACVGFPNEIPALARLSAIESFLSHFAHAKHTSTGNFMKGPRNKRVVSPAAFVEFASADACREFLAEAKGTEFRLENSARTLLKVKPATSKINEARNWALRRAEEQINASSFVNGKVVKADFSLRTVNVGSTLAFEQKTADLDGTFLDRFSGLTLR